MVRPRVEISSPRLRDQGEFLAAVGRSRKLHRPWTSPPTTPKRFRLFVARQVHPSFVPFLVRRRDTSELVGCINISNIVTGVFRSGYLGYYAFVPHHRQGFLSEGMALVLGQAFRRLKLHRLEANIQPGNEASRRLVMRLGFRLEGFSPRYLKIGGLWRDHERWAITAEDWRALRRKMRRPHVPRRTQ